MRWTRSGARSGRGGGVVHGAEHSRAAPGRAPAAAPGVKGLPDVPHRPWTWVGRRAKRKIGARAARRPARAGPAARAADLRHLARRPLPASADEAHRARALTRGVPGALSRGARGRRAARARCGEGALLRRGGGARAPTRARRALALRAPARAALLRRQRRRAAGLPAGLYAGGSLRERMLAGRARTRTRCGACSSTCSRRSPRPTRRRSSTST